MNKTFLMRKKSSADRLLKLDLSNDLYAGISIFHIINGINVEQAEKNLLFTANWFEHPHPLGRDPRGEPDFASAMLIAALYHCYNKVSDECRNALDRFYLTQDFQSKYPSENHYLLFRISRLLAAEFYKDRYFEQYGLTSDEIIKEDEKYIDEFLMYRARCSWGEFDSCGYAGEIMEVLNVLYAYTTNQRLKRKAAMSMDIILLDMIADSKNGLYGGAHGRIYPDVAVNSSVSSMYRIYCYYFGAAKGMPNPSGVGTRILLSDYYPSEIVCKLVNNRKYPYENKERKHLHLPSAWDKEIRYDMIDAVKDYSIDKYLFISDDYMLGSVNHQDLYPDAVQSDRWYAHHEQHEWELTLPGDGRIKIFSHHPGTTKEHNQWTGDIGCNCGTHFCTKDTAISMYNIEKEDQFSYINAYIPFDFFEEVHYDKNYIFLKYKNNYIMVWFANDYKICTTGVLSAGTPEVISDGRKHAFICHIDNVNKYCSFEDFIGKMKTLVIDFDAEKMSIAFNNIYMDYNERFVNGEKQIFPYEKLFDNPYVQSEYYSAIFEVTDGNDRVVYDFNF